MLGGSVPVTQTLVSFPHMAGQGLRYGLAAAVLIPPAARARWQRAHPGHRLDPAGVRSSKPATPAQG